MNNMDLVLEGGGVKGIALVGAISALRDAGYQAGATSRVAGTSAGAIVASLVAAGTPVDELTQMMRGLDYRRFRDASRFGRLGNLVSLVGRLGLYRGDWLHGWIREQLAAHNVRTFGDLRIQGDAGSALGPDRSYRLVVIVSDVSRARMLRLPWDYRRLFGVDPDEQQVADAVRASASIPFFFQPVKVADRWGGAPYCLTDGGMLSNFPIDLFDRDDVERPRWPTFGIKLSAAPPETQGRNDKPAVRGVLELTEALMATMIQAHDRIYLDDPSVRARTIFVDTDGVGTTDFDLPSTAREALYGNGVRAAQDFLRAWDFDTYLHNYRPQAVPAA